jgi:hypothetical protein
VITIAAGLLQAPKTKNNPIEIPSFFILLFYF